MINLDAIYVDVDDFCVLFEPQWLAHLIETCEKRIRIVITSLIDITEEFN